MHAEHDSNHVLEYIEISGICMLDSFRSSGTQTRRVRFRPIITNMVAIPTENGLCRAYLLCILKGWFNCCPEKFIHLAPCFTKSIYAALPNLSEVPVKRRSAQYYQHHVNSIPFQGLDYQSRWSRGTCHQRDGTRSTRRKGSPCQDTCSLSELS